MCFNGDLSYVFWSFDSKILKFCWLHTEFCLFYKFEGFFLPLNSEQAWPPYRNLFFRRNPFTGQIFLYNFVASLYILIISSMTPTYSPINLKISRFNLQFREIKAITEKSSSWMKQKMFYPFVGRALFTLF